MKSKHGALAARRAVREAVLRFVYAKETGGEPEVPEALPPAGQARFDAETASLVEAPDHWDGLFAPHLAPGWSIERVGLIERLLLRMACWELWEAPDVPPKVSLSEHVALARKYVDGVAATFVHGVLGSVIEASPKADRSIVESDDEGWTAVPDESEDPAGQAAPSWILKAQ